MQEYNKNLPDGSYLVTIESTKKRTNDQNQYYWGVVVPAVYNGLREAGFNEVKSRDDAHLVMKSLFLKQHIPGKDGEAFELIRSTTGLKTLEFSKYLMDIFQWASEYLGVVIPEPNEQLEFQL